MRLYDFLDKTVVKENAEGLNIGDEVEITGNVQFAGATGVIDNFGKDKRFVIVNLYNHGRHSFHSSDVSFNDYADSDNEEADMYDRDEDFRRSMSNEHIVKVKGGYRLLSKHGNKNLGTYPTRAGAEKRERQVQYFKHAGESVEQGVEEGAEFGAYYYEQLAQKVFDQYPDLNNEDNILHFGYTMAKEELGKRANGIFRDEDFPGDFVSSYKHLQKQGVAETKVSKYKDLGASDQTTHFIKNMTTGEIVSPHRGLHDAEDALSAHHRRPDGNEYKIVRARKQGVAEAFQNDEANLWYRYDKTDGRLKQAMIANLDEPNARSQGYRDSIDGALRVAGIIRSKFDPKKFVQKQGNGWVTVYPFGKQETKEASDISGLMAASELNKVFVVKTDTKSYKVKAQSARVASEKVSKAHPEAKIVSVKDVTDIK
jgi:hypothetical protein